MPEKLLKRQETLENKLSALEEAEADEAEYQKVQQQLEQVEAKIAEYSGFSEEEKAIAGCIVTIGWSGEADITFGLVKPEDDTPAELEPEEDGDADGDGEEDNDEEGVSFRDDARPDSKFEYSNALSDRLKANRLQVMRLHMAEDYATAFDAALYMMWPAQLKPILLLRP